MIGIALKKKLLILFFFLSVFCFLFYLSRGGHVFTFPDKNENFSSKTIISVLDSSLLDLEGNPILDTILQGEIYVFEFFFKRTFLNNLSYKYHKDTNIYFVSVLCDRRLSSGFVLRQYEKSIKQKSEQWMFASMKLSTVGILFQQNIEQTYIKEYNLYVLFDKNFDVRGIYDAEKILSIEDDINRLKKMYNEK